MSIYRWLCSAGPPVGCEIGLVSGFGRLDSRGVGPATCGAKTTSRTETGNNFEEFSHINSSILRKVQEQLFWFKGVFFF
jgi:hypothetical protein